MQLLALAIRPPTSLKRASGSGRPVMRLLCAAVVVRECFFWLAGMDETGTRPDGGGLHLITFECWSFTHNILPKSPLLNVWPKI